MRLPCTALLLEILGFILEANCKEFGFCLSYHLHLALWRCKFFGSSDQILSRSLHCFLELFDFALTLAFVLFCFDPF